VDTAGCNSIHLVPGVRGTSGRRDGAEEKMAPWSPEPLRSGPRKATIDGWPLMTSAIESVMVGNHVPRIFD
jgi:hypothetical protein